MCKFFYSPESLLSSPKPQMEEALIVDSVGGDVRGGARVGYIYFTLFPT